MIDYRGVKKIYFYTKEIDMRAGMKKFQILLCCNFSPIAMMHTLFVFCSKDRKTLKIYYEDEYGTWLLINKISFTKFKWPERISGSGYRVSDLKQILRGLKIMEEKTKEIGY
ncbi:MAG: IS66 family insertion sequence element accessory protein TnpB [Candidatus Izemoplasmatales bacterium]|nr:IS66 family insertion sequence element accessory protein TnpB [Candidatus Izemoplasmatales bacterium]